MDEKCSDLLSSSEVSFEAQCRCGDWRLGRCSERPLGDFCESRGMTERGRCSEGS